MKILYLTPMLPYPLDNGGKIKTWGTLKLLHQKNHEVHLACFSASQPSGEALKMLRTVCAEVNVIISPYACAKFGEMKSFIFKGLFSKLPFASYRYLDKKMESLIKNLLKKEKFEAIHIDHLNMACYLTFPKTCQWVLEEHNLESEIAQKIVILESPNKFKLFSVVEWLKLLFFEKNMLPKFDKILAISEKDAQKLKKRGIPKDRVMVLPMVVKVKPSFSFQKVQPVLFFVATLDWWPNKNGLKWFLREVMPEVRKKIKIIKLVVVGKGADKEMPKFIKNNPDLQYEGYQKDLDKYWNRSGLFIVPLRCGSGVRVKLLEALSRGVPVVATKKGAEGIMGKSANGVILADNKFDFAKAVIRLCQDKKLAQEMSQSATQFIKTNYSEEKALNIIGKLYPS